MHTSVSPGVAAVTVGYKQQCCPDPSVSRQGKQDRTQTQWFHARDWSVGLERPYSPDVLQELQRASHLPVIDASSPMAHQE